ncbi:MAG: hypothetical protein U0946_00170 [Patescibacteria group bacterium]|nr:hypothetical protein [Patescibacteria group bacterium]
MIDAMRNNPEKSDEEILEIMSGQSGYLSNLWRLMKEKGLTNRDSNEGKDLLRMLELARVIEGDSQKEKQFYRDILENNFWAIFNDLRLAGVGFAYENEDMKEVWRFVHTMNNRLDGATYFNNFLVQTSLMGVFERNGDLLTTVLAGNMSIEEVRELLEFVVLK